MSQNKVQFDESGAKRFKDNNTVDSDDEDETGDREDPAGALADEDIEGQEDATIDRDGDIQITPFNMKDEMEEGHFDSEGMFVFDKNKDIKDNWIDNVDWVKVIDEKDRIKETQVNDLTEDLKDCDYIDIYNSMLELVKPGETVLKSVRRLGAGKQTLSASQRWGKKKQKSGTTTDDTNSSQNSENMLRLTELADKLIQDGNMDIYEATHEKITFLLKKLQEPALPGKSVLDSTDDVELDMFADQIDEERGVKRKLEEDAGSVKAPDTTTSATDEISWMYRWQNRDDSELLGPVPNSQMLEWSNGDYFAKGAYCRKVNTEGEFYNVKRIDFDLYT